jgi:hypothetical protein
MYPPVISVYMLTLNVAASSDGGLDISIPRVVPAHTP